MFSKRKTLLLIPLFFVGCATLPLGYSRKLSQQISDCSYLEIRAWRSEAVVRIDDPTKIAKLQEIYIRSPRNLLHFDTEPSDLIEINGWSNGKRTFQLIYGLGWMWECKNEKWSRRIDLNKDDADWIDANFKAIAPLNKKVHGEVI